MSNQTFPARKSRRWPLLILLSALVLCLIALNASRLKALFIKPEVAARLTLIDASDPFPIQNPPTQTVDTKFVDVAKAAGLDYKWNAVRPMTIFESVGHGCAFLDVNNDGNLDVLLVGPKLALYLGDGKGHFRDVTKQYGLDQFTDTYSGCCVGDYDNDGWDDIYISGWHTGLLLHNEKGERFTDVTKEAGLVPQRWGTSCAFSDLDNDGFLDLVIANYVDFDPKVKSFCHRNDLTDSIPCGPLDYLPIAPTIYHNVALMHTLPKNSRGFVDVSSIWQVTANGGGLGVSCADYDGSGHPSIAIANDLRYGDLLHFNPTPVQSPSKEYQADRQVITNIASMIGVSAGFAGRPHAGMGIDWGDVDNNGRLDFFVTTFQGEPRSLYMDMGNGAFSDMAMQTGAMDVCMRYLAFGVKFIDVDNDGRLDLLIANGHVNDKVQRYEPKSRFRQPVQLLRNVEGHPLLRFDDISQQAGMRDIPFIVGRGLAIGDFDNDGRMDALVVDNEGTPLLLHNESTRVGHWVECKLIGTKSNHDAIGAMVTFMVGGQSLLRRCSADGSFESSSDLRVHVGLGDEQRVDISVKWPSGAVNEYKGVEADHIVTLQEGDDRPR